MKAVAASAIAVTGGPFGQAALEWARLDPRVRELFDEVARLGVQAFLVGGAIRDFCVGRRPTDIDLVVPNDDSRVHAFLAARYTGKTNRHGNVRFRGSDGVQIDVIRPASFYKAFGDPREAIAYFDVSVNAVGVNICSGEVFDPLGGIDDLRHRRVRTTGARWSEMSAFESAHVTLRLIRYVERYELKVIDPENARRHIDKLETIEWRDLQRLHGLTRIEAVEKARAQLDHR